ncbi:MAG: hypothetical protein NT023_04085, partial [Armatimonadetes bacterium]|nr:hypothetical protein [Armatimonadota bacterium]
MPPSLLHQIFAVCTIAFFIAGPFSSLLISMYYANKRKQAAQEAKLAKEAANRPKNRERVVRYGDEELTRLEEAQKRREASQLTPKEQFQLFGVILIVLLFICGIGAGVTAPPYRYPVPTEPGQLHLLFMGGLQLVIYAGLPIFAILGVAQLSKKWHEEQEAKAQKEASSRPPNRESGEGYGGDAWKRKQAEIKRREEARKTPAEQNAIFGMVLLGSAVVCFLGWVATAPPYRYPVPEEPGFLNILFLRCLQLALFVGLPAFAIVGFAPAYKRLQAEREAKDAEEARARRAKAQQDIEDRRRAEAEQKR